MSLADDIERLVREGADEAILELARMVAEQAKANMPVGDPSQDPDETVAMRENVTIRRGEGGGNFFIVAVETEYAAWQHEQLQAQHPRGGGPKFLERALTTVVPALGPGIVAGKVRANIDRRGGRRGQRG